MKAQEGNPFGRWTTHRARVASLTRPDAHNAELEAETRGLLTAARLADRILAVRDTLTSDQRKVLAGLLKETK